MPRTRSVPDHALLDAVLSVIASSGPDGVTFQAIAAATGLSPATLVQRFGTKQKMLRAALVRAWDHLDGATEKADAESGPTPSGAVAMLVKLTGDGDKELATGLLVLREDFRDSVLRRRGARWGETLAAALGRRLGRRGKPRPDLGRLMAAQWQGAMLWWGFSQAGSLRHHVQSELGRWVAAIGRPVKPAPR